MAETEQETIAEVRKNHAKAIKRFWAIFAAVILWFILQAALPSLLANIVFLIGLVVMFPLARWLFHND